MRGVSLFCDGAEFAGCEDEVVLQLGYSALGVIETGAEGEVFVS